MPVVSQLVQQSREKNPGSLALEPHCPALMSSEGERELE